MSQNPAVGIILTLDGDKTVKAGLEGVGKAFAVSAEDALKLERASASVAVAQARLEAAIAKSAAAQRAYTDGVRAGVVSQEAMDKLARQATDAASAEALALVKLKEQAGGLKKLEDAHAGVTTQTKLSGYHTAQLSAQLQDMFVQIQAGQSPMTALIQQGSQLSAVFGGFRPALAAVGSLLSPLVLGLGAAAAAVGSLGLAWVKGKEQDTAFRVSLALTGNAAGATADSVRAMAIGIAKDTQTGIGTAKDVLQVLVASGKVSADALQATGATASAMARVTGESAADIAKRFAGMADDVAASAKKLNEQYHFLTAAEYERIKSMQDSGNASGALSETMSKLGDQVKGAATQLGTMERAWGSVKSAASGAWDAMLGIGRDQTLGEALASAQDRAARLQTAPRHGSALRIGDQPGDAQAAIDNASALRAAAGYQSLNAYYAGETAKKEQLKTEWGEKVEASLSNQAQWAKRIKDLNEKADAAGLDKNDPKRLQLINQEWQKSAALADAQALAMARVGADVVVQSARTAAALQAIQGQFEKGLLSPIEQIEQMGKVEAAQLKFDQAAIGRQIKIAALKGEAGAADVARLTGEASAKAIEIKTRAAKAEDDILTNQILLRNKAAEAYRAQVDEEAAATAAFASVQQKSQAAYQLAVRESSLAIDDQIKLSQVERNTALSSAEVRAVEITQLRSQIDLRKQLDALAKQDLEPAARAAAEKTILTDSARTTAEAVTKIHADAWTKQFVDIRDGLADALLDGGKTGWKKLSDLIKRDVLRPIIQAAVTPISNTITDAIRGTSGNGTSGGGNGLLSGYSLGGSSGASSASQYGVEIGGADITLADAGAGLSYLDAFMSAKGGQWGAAIGEGVGTYFYGPIGGIIGKTIGSAIDKYFAGGAGTPHVGGYVSVDSATGSVADITRAQGGRGDAGAQTLVTNLATSLNLALVSGAKAFGVTAGASVRAVFESDSQDKSWGIFQVLDKVGAQIAGFGAKGTFAADPKTGFTEFSAEAALAIRDALRAADIPAWASDALSKITASSGADALIQTVSGIIQTQQAIEAFDKRFSPLGAIFTRLSLLSSDASANLAKMAGGIDALASNITSYIDNFYLDAEKTALTLAGVGAALADVGLTLPATREEFRKLVDAQDLTTASGQSAFNTLMQVQGAFAGVVPVAETMAETVVKSVAK